MDFSISLLNAIACSEAIWPLKKESHERSPGAVDGLYAPVLLRRPHKGLSAAHGHGKGPATSHAEFFSKHAALVSLMSPFWSSNKCVRDIDNTSAAANHV